MLNEKMILMVGEKIKRLRLEKNISQERLAFITGFHRTYIGMIERGERNISITNLTVFAKAFELSISTLLDFNDIDPGYSYKNYQLKNKRINQ